MAAVAQVKTLKTPREVVVGALEALGDLRVEDFVASLTEDVVWRIVGGDYMPNGGKFDGKQEILTKLIPMAGSIYDLSTFGLEIKAVYSDPDSDSVVVEFALTADTPLGARYDSAPHCAIFAVRDGLIANGHEYVDTRYAQRILFP
jgi:ketosteroid isomerase-like protein